MPSSPATKPATEPTKRILRAEEILTLYLQNLRAIRDWYRAAPGRGVEIGHYTVGEIAAGENVAALEAALEGRTWKAPEIPKA